MVSEKEAQQSWEKWSKSKADIAHPEYTGGSENDIDINAVQAAYDALPAVSPDFLIKTGDWKGGYFDTGHPGGVPLVQMGWKGKRFNSADDVNPIIVEQNGQRVPIPVYGEARLRKVEFRGKLSAAMVYDSHAIIDNFRYINDKMIAGGMDARVTPELAKAGNMDLDTLLKHPYFFFYLYKD